MTNPTPQINKSTAEYKAGYADGGAIKWKYIARMWGSLGLFLLVVLIFAVPDLYKSYNDNQTKQNKIQACGHAQDVSGCISAVGK